jgi:hypothetical protein
LSRALGVATLLGLGLTLGLNVSLASDGSAGYAPSRVFPTDTTRSKTAEHAAASRTLAIAVPGYLSSWGLPPVRGQFTVSDTVLTFRSSEGASTPLAATLSLAYVARANGRLHYLFRVDGGVFETDAPGPLLDVVNDSLWRRIRRSPARLPVALPADSASRTASLLAAQRIGASLYADTLYRLFGRPRAAVGLIGPRGRVAGRLGEYIAGRDSLALDPGRMTGKTQLRHALAHELGHRWQGRSKAELAALWSGVPPIRDPKRYGYGDTAEHQAEALAFAINFLQTTAAGTSASAALPLLDHYELLVPGTRTMVRYLFRQPIYRKHPLRIRLSAPPLKYARAR